MRIALPDKALHLMCACLEVRPRFLGQIEKPGNHGISESDKLNRKNFPPPSGGGKDPMNSPRLPQYKVRKILNTIRAPCPGVDCVGVFAHARVHTSPRRCREGGGLPDAYEHHTRQDTAKTRRNG